MATDSRPACTVVRDVGKKNLIMVQIPCIIHNIKGRVQKSILSKVSVVFECEWCLKAHMLNAQTQLGEQIRKYVAVGWTCRFQVPMPVPMSFSWPFRYYSRAMRVCSCHYYNGLILQNSKQELNNMLSFISSIIMVFHSSTRTVTNTVKFL